MNTVVSVVHLFKWKSATHAFKIVHPFVIQTFSFDLYESIGRFDTEIMKTDTNFQLL